MPRPVILVNGLPAAGKSTLAPALARALGLPLFSKDVIKETHADVLGAQPPAWWTRRGWSRALGVAAAETMWAVLAEAYAGAVLESSWRADTRPQVEAGLAKGGVTQVAEVWCEAPLALLRQRYDRRAAGRHAIHGPPLDQREWALMSNQALPLGLGPVCRVDTSG